MFNVNKLTSSISKTGVAQASHFDVQISYSGGSIEERDLNMRADSANLPGRTMMTMEHKFTNYGPINKVPYSQVYGDFTVSFIMSEDLREKDYFEKWHDAMVNTGAYEYTSRPRSYSKFNTRYFDDYVGTVIVRQYGAAGNLRTIHKLNEAYPLLIGEVGMDWSSGDLAKLQVTFAYRNYEYITEDNSNQPGLGLGFSFNASRDGRLQAGLRVPGFGNVSLKQPPLGAIVAASPQLINQGIQGLSNIVNKGKSFFKI